MGKIRVAKLGDEETEKELKRRAEARRQTKQSKKPFEKTRGKQKVEHVGLKGGERVAVIEGTEIKPEFKRLVEEVEKGQSSAVGDQISDKKKKEKAKVHVRSKKYKEVSGFVDKTKFYELSDAIKLVRKTSLTKFDGTVELHVNLNPNTLGEKKDLRGTVSLPHGTGKEVRVVIADDTVLGDIEAGRLDFDVLVAPPSMMPKLAKYARVLGPKGLMPNPKNGTVTDDPAKRAKELAHGQVNFKTEPDNPIIHLSVGKVSFEEKKLLENIDAALSAIGKNKILRATLTATMGPGIKLQIA